MSEPSEPFVARESAAVREALQDAAEIIRTAQRVWAEAGQPNKSGDALVEALKALYNASKWASASATSVGGYYNHVVDPRVVGPPGKDLELEGVKLLRADGTYPRLRGYDVPEFVPPENTATLGWDVPAGSTTD